MFYTVYKTTCVANNKVYIGVHKTKDLNDGYLGSGKLISRAIEKYGRASFEKEILFVFDNEDDMFAKERELVTEEFVTSEQTYNLKPGGEANWYFVNKNGLNHKVNQHLILRDKVKNDPNYANQFSEKMSEASYFRKLNSSKSPEERKAAAKRAAEARWAKYRNANCGGDGEVT